MIKPIVSVVIVSFNTRALTVKCIKSVYVSRGFKPGQIEVIVVDNHSQDDTTAYLKANFPRVRLIINQTNLGFGAGNNQGAAIAQGQYLLLLNTDAFLLPDSLRTLIEIMEKHADVVSVGPQLRYPDASLQSSGGYFPTPLRVLAWMWWLDKLPLIKQFFPKPYHVLDLAWYQKPQSPDWLMGACILLRTLDFLQIGGFDEQIFMYAEEVEFYLRLKDRPGKKLSFTPKTSVVHLGSASTKRASASRLVGELKGITYIYSKHYPHSLWFIRFVIYTGVVLRLIVFGLMPSRHEAVLEYKKFFRTA